MADEVRELIGVSEAARIAGRCPNTVRNWIRKGLLPAQKVGENGRFKIRKADLKAALTYEPPGGKDDQ